MATLASVKSCTMTACSYNKNGCTAGAVTIGGSNGSATCGTFVELDARGGLPTAQGQVGACKRLECKHNTDLMCSLQAITVSDTAMCELYEVN